MRSSLFAPPWRGKNCTTAELLHPYSEETECDKNGKVHPSLRLLIDGHRRLHAKKTKVRAFHGRGGSHLGLRGGGI